MIIETLAIGSALLAAASDGTNSPDSDLDRRKWKLAFYLDNPRIFLEHLYLFGGKERVFNFLSGKVPGWVLNSKNLDELSIRIRWFEKLITSYNASFRATMRILERLDAPSPVEDSRGFDVPSFGDIPIQVVASVNPDDWSNEDALRIRESGAQVLDIMELYRLLEDTPEFSNTGSDPQLWSWDATRMLIRFWALGSTQSRVWVVVPRHSRSLVAPA